RCFGCERHPGENQSVRRELLCHSLFGPRCYLVTTGLGRSVAAVSHECKYQTSLPNESVLRGLGQKQEPAKQEVGFDLVRLLQRARKGRATVAPPHPPHLHKPPSCSICRDLFIH
ncbi:hypothetical protein CLAIMM_13435, partial [Cladophialophora immunda]